MYHTHYNSAEQEGKGLYGIFVVDPKNGKIVRQVGKVGDGDGQFMYPEGLAYLGGDRYAVADKFNERIQIVRIPLPGATVSTGLAGALTRLGPGDFGLILIWCAVPLGLLLLALLVFLALRRRADKRSTPEAEVTSVTSDDEES